MRLMPDPNTDADLAAILSGCRGVRTHWMDTFKGEPCLRCDVCLWVVPVARTAYAGRIEGRGA